MAARAGRGDTSSFPASAGKQTPGVAFPGGTCGEGRVLLRDREGCKF